MNEDYIVLDHKEAETYTCQDCDVFVDGYAVVYRKKEVQSESTID